jgi:hypothetical protein
MSERFLTCIVANSDLSESSTGYRMHLFVTIIKRSFHLPHFVGLYVSKYKIFNSNIMDCAATVESLQKFKFRVLCLWCAHNEKLQKKCMSLLSHISRSVSM